MIIDFDRITRCRVQFFGKFLNVFSFFFFNDFE